MVAHSVTEDLPTDFQAKKLTNRGRNGVADLTLP
jgi:hypothetical protein